MTKAQIVDEIRRAAAKNGGKAPGWRKFLAETGIREADWLGVHWARWSDAVREAGLEPNQLNEAFPDEVLLDHLAELATELGRLPNRGDHRFREARGTPFPNNKVFARLGGQSERVARLRQHCIERPRWAAVVEYCDAFSSKRAASPNPTEDDAGVLGVVYMLKSGKHYKIGRSNALGRREYELALQLPERAAVVHSINTDDPVGIEAYWHRRFELKRANGEWFSLEPRDVAAFRRRRRAGPAPAAVRSRPRRRQTSNAEAAPKSAWGVQAQRRRARHVAQHRPGPRASIDTRPRWRLTACVGPDAGAGPALRRRSGAERTAMWREATS